MSRQFVTESKTSRNTIPDTSSEQLQRKHPSRPGVNTRLNNIDNEICASAPSAEITSSQNSDPGSSGDFSAISVKQSAFPVVQAKLKIGQHNDKYEQEADRVAEQVVQMPCSQVQRYSENGKSMQMNEHQTSFDDAPLGYTGGNVSFLKSNTQTQNTGGRKLSEQEKIYFEPRINADFSSVRLHTEPEVASAASTFGARAFTIGNHIALARGEYNFHLPKGKQLLAHELTHVVQQTMAPRQLEPISSGSTGIPQAKGAGAVTPGARPGHETLIKSLTQVPMLQRTEHEFRLQTPTLRLPQRRPLSLFPPGEELRLRFDILDLRGIKNIYPLATSVPPPFLTGISRLPAGSSPGGEGEAERFWDLEFEIDVDDDSSLGRAMARQEQVTSIISGEEAEGTPLALELTNAAINILIATPEGAALRERLGLSDFRIIFNPLKDEFVIGAVFEFKFPGL